ncbi:unnamed protein product [Pedinophyceae sp. YPF-701]|nr:unnamed protein product [Pedinophyceae sp. YPF-701]
MGTETPRGPPRAALSAGIHSPLHALSRGDVELLQTSTLATLSARFQTGRVRPPPNEFVAPGAMGAVDQLLGARPHLGAVDLAFAASPGLEGTASRPRSRTGLLSPSQGAGRIQLDPIRITGEGQQGPALPPLPSIFPPAAQGEDELSRTLPSRLGGPLSKSQDLGGARAVNAGRGLAALHSLMTWTRPEHADATSQTLILGAALQRLADAGVGHARIDPTSDASVDTFDLGDAASPGRRGRAMAAIEEAPDASGRPSTCPPNAEHPAQSRGIRLSIQGVEIRGAGERPVLPMMGRGRHDDELEERLQAAEARVTELKAELQRERQARTREREEHNKFKRSQQEAYETQLRDIQSMAGEIVEGAEAAGSRPASASREAAAATEARAAEGAQAGQFLEKVREVYEARIQKLQARGFELKRELGEVEKEREALIKEIQLLKNREASSAVTAKMRATALEAKLAASKSKVEKLEEVQAELQDVIAAKTEEVDRLIKEGRERENEVSSALADRDGLKKRLRDAESQLRKREAEWTEAEAGLQDRVTQLETVLEKERAAVAVDLKEYHRIKVTYEDLERRLKAAETLFNEETAKVAGMKFDRDEARAAERNAKRLQAQAEKEVVEWQERVKSLRESEQHAQKLIAHLRAQLREKDNVEKMLDNAKQELLRQQEERRGEIETWSKRYEVLEDKAAMLGREIRAANYRAEDAARKAHDAERDRDKLEGDVQAFRDQVRTMAIKLDEAQSQCAQARGEAFSANQQLQESAQESAELRKSLAELRKVADSRGVEVDRLVKERDILQNQLNEAQKELAGTTRTLEAQIEELTAERKELTKKNDALRSSVRQLAPYKRRAEELQQLHDNLSARHNELTDKYSALMDERLQLITDLEETRRNLKYTQQSLEQARGDLDSKVAECEQLLSELTDEQEALKNALAREKVLKDRVEVLESELAQTTAELTELKAAHAKLEAEHARLSDLYDELQITSQRQITMLTEQRDQLAEERDTLKRERSARDEMLQDLSAKLEDPLSMPQVQKVVEGLRAKLENETQQRIFREKFATTQAQRVKVLEAQLKRANQIIADSGATAPPKTIDFGCQVIPTDLWETELDTMDVPAVRRNTGERTTLPPRSPLGFVEPGTPRDQAREPRADGSAAADAEVVDMGWIAEARVRSGVEREKQLRAIKEESSAHSQASAKPANTNPRVRPGRLGLPSNVRDKLMGRGATPLPVGRGGASRGEGDVEEPQYEGEVPSMDVGAVMDVIFECYALKLRADVAAARHGGAPRGLSAFVRDFFVFRYSIPRLARRALVSFAKSVCELKGFEAVASFGLSSGLLDEEEVHVKELQPLPPAVAAEPVWPTAATAAPEGSTARGGHALSYGEATVGVSHRLGRTAPGTPSQRGAGGSPSGRSSPGRTSPLPQMPGAGSRSFTPRHARATTGADGSLRRSPASHSRATTPPSHRPGSAAGLIEAAAARVGSLHGNASAEPWAAGAELPRPAAFPADLASGVPPEELNPLHRMALGPFTGLPLPLLWGAMRSGQVYRPMRMQPRKPPSVQAMLHPLIAVACKQATSTPPLSSIEHMLKSSLFREDILPSLDLGVPVSGRQVPQIATMLHDIALVFHLDPSRLPQVFIRPDHEPRALYMCLPLALTRDRTAIGTVSREAVARREDDLKHCIVLSSGLLDTLQPSEVMSAISGAMFAFVLGYWLNPSRADECDARSSDGVIPVDAMSTVPWLATAASISDIASYALAQAIDGDSVLTFERSALPVLSRFKQAWRLCQDRASLVAVQDLKTVISGVLKQSAGSHALVGELHAGALLDQLEEDAAKSRSSAAGWVADSGSVAEVRAREAFKWSKSKEYGRTFVGAEKRTHFA